METENTFKIVTERDELKSTTCPPVMFFHHQQSWCAAIAKENSVFGIAMNDGFVTLYGNHLRFRGIAHSRLLA